MGRNEKIGLVIIVSLSALLYLFNTRLEFFLDDPGLFAKISANITDSNDWINLKLSGKDWLDKPHLPFWIISVFFEIFGVHSWSFYLPHSLALIAGLLYTYKFALRIYTRDVALLSVFILATAQHIFMASTEGRVEPFLMLFIIAAVFHFDGYLSTFSKKDCLIACLMTSCAIMTKGIFVVVPILGAVIGHEIISRKSFKPILKWYWLIIGILILLFITPELVALWIQFDSQPKKIVFGREGVSGIMWFLWDSQFSRLVNDGPITRSDGNIFYYVHTMAWALFPWCLIFYYAVYKRISNTLQGKEVKEYYTIAGSLLMLFLFSISKFQLPHYVTIIFPFCAILTAQVILDVFSSKEKTAMSCVLMTQNIFALGAMIYLCWLMNIGMLKSISIVLLIVIVWGILIKKIKPRFLIAIAISGLMTLCLNFMISILVFPTVSAHRGDNKAALYINDTYPDTEVLTLGAISHRFNFYLNDEVTKEWQPNANKIDLYKEYNIILTLQQEFVPLMNATHEVVARFEHYRSEHISPKFLDPNTRDAYVEEYVVLKKISQ